MSNHKLVQQYRDYWDKGAAVYDEIVDAEFVSNRYDQWKGILSHFLSGKNTELITLNASCRAGI